MMTLRLFSRKFESVPAATSWYLADLGEARGKQELFTRQSPQSLKALREHALIESAVSSNRIEGVEVDQSRIATIVFGKSLLRDRDEEEVWGYRQALTMIHEQGAKLPISEATTLTLHRLTRGHTRPLAVYQLPSFHRQDGVSGIRTAHRSTPESQGGENAPHSSSDRQDARTFQRSRSSTPISECQRGFDPAYSEKCAGYTSD